MLEPEALQQLRNRKNLLAFSAGIDSTALYHLLKEKKIPFDIALVNYKSRPQSDEEASYAKSLAEQDGKKLFLLERKVEGRDFEHRARKIRYTFFENIIAEERYENLVTAHQLDDMLEWALMQLCKGCGTAEMVGMQPVEERKCYTLVRPLLFTPKTSLLSYLEERQIHYFVDTSNLEERYTRNRFRHQAAAFLMEECSEGIARSFRYLLADKQSLLPPQNAIFRYKNLTLFKRPESELQTIRLVDRQLKENGYLLTRAQKEEIVNNRSVVIGGIWVVEITERFVWIAPYTKTEMPKQFRERCRSSKIPEKIRPYLFVTDGLERLLSALDSFSS